jgi:AcrR family transcriptional regulator
MADTTPAAAASGPAATSTRDRIVEAALRLIAERGTAATSMRDLASAAEVTVPGLYYHFESKADLIRAVLSARGLEGVVGDASGPGGDDDLPPDVEGRIRVRAARELERLVEHADFLRIIQREAALGDPDAQHVGAQLRAGWQARWTSTLARARDLAPTVDLDAASDCVTTYLWGVFVDYLSRGDEPAGDRIPAFAALLAKAMRATP